METTVPDLLRLVVVPVLGWAAWRDLQVRRVPNRLWLPLVGLGVVLLLWEGWRVVNGPDPTGYRRRLFVLEVVVSLGFVAPMAYLIWRVGGFGGADAKALMTLAVVVPTTPTYVVPQSGADLVFPFTATIPGAWPFSLTVLTNTVVVAMTFPAVVTVRNLLGRDFSLAMVVGTRVPCTSIPERHGSLMETPDGLTRRGLDIDALRMYLRWRDATLEELRDNPGWSRDPTSLPDEPSEPTRGAIADGGEVADGAVPADSGADENEEWAYDDPWGAEAFMDDVPHAWGSTAEDVREGLEVLTGQDRVWYSPGIPFVVPMFVGLLVALLYGDLLVSAMIWAGLGG